MKSALRYDVRIARIVVQYYEYFHQKLHITMPIVTITVYLQGDSEL